MWAKSTTMADSFAAPLRSVSFRTFILGKLFVWGGSSSGEALRLGKLFVWGSSSSGEALHLWRLFVWGGSSSGEALRLGRLFIWGDTSSGETLRLGRLFVWGGCTDTNAYWKILWIPSKEVCLEGFPSVSFVVDMARCRDACSFCLLTSMELIIIQTAAYCICMMLMIWTISKM